MTNKLDPPSSHASRWSVRHEISVKWEPFGHMIVWMTNYYQTQLTVLLSYLNPQIQSTSLGKYFKYLSFARSAKWQINHFIAQYKNVGLVVLQFLPVHLVEQRKIAKTWFLNFNYSSIRNFCGIFIVIGRISFNNSSWFQNNQAKTTEKLFQLWENKNM